MSEVILSRENEGSVSWYKEITTMQWKNLFASWLGWVLDAMDMMLYACVLVPIMNEWGLTMGNMGLVGTISLVGSAFGGIIFGLFSDYRGRTKALMLTILVYSLFSGLSGLSQTLLQLIICRFCLGLGMGGEWGAGAALVAETWPAKHRGKAIGIMHTGWAVGYILAALLAGYLTPVWGWRGVFFVGVIPGLFVFWILSSIKEPEIWKKMDEQKTKAVGGKSTFKLWQIFERDLLPKTLLATILSCVVMFAYWGLFTWLPGYLALPVTKGGAGLSITRSTLWLVVIQIGALAGSFCFGFISDRVGRRKTFFLYLAVAAAMVPLYGLYARTTILLISLGFAVGFFGWGFFGGFGALLSELFPTRVRGTASGFSFNVGRGVGAIAPFTIGVLAQTHGIGLSLTLTAVFYLASAFVVLLMPETVGKELD